MSEFIPIMLNRLNRYVEEVLMWCVQRTADPFVVVEIPFAARDPQKPERFRLSLPSDAQPWHLVYSDDAFEDV